MVYVNHNMLLLINGGNFASVNIQKICLTLCVLESKLRAAFTSFCLLWDCRCRLHGLDMLNDLLPQCIVIWVILEVGDVLVEGFLGTAGLRLRGKQRKKHRNRHDGANDCSEVWCHGGLPCIAPSCLLTVLFESTCVHRIHPCS